MAKSTGVSRAYRSYLGSSPSKPKSTRYGGRTQGFAFELDDEALQAALVRMLENTENLTDMWDFYHSAFSRGVKTHFASRGGGAWRKVGVRYAYYKAKAGGGSSLLRWTGRLYRSLLESGGGGEHSFEPKPRYMRVQSLRTTEDGKNLAAIHATRRKGRRSPFSVRAKTFKTEWQRAGHEALERYGALWEGRAE